MKFYSILLFVLFYTLGRSQRATTIFVKLDSCEKVDLSDLGRQFALEMRLLSFDQLDSIIEVGSSVAKVYGFWGYIQKEGNDYRKHFTQLVLDTSIVSFQPYGCRSNNPEEVGKVIFDLAMNVGASFGSYPDYAYFLDSISFELEKRFAIYGNINVRIGNIKPPSTLYTKVRERARSGDVSATMGLANFQNEDDLPIFNSFFQNQGLGSVYSMICIERFPHESFEPILLRQYYLLLEVKEAYGFRFTTSLLLKYRTDEVKVAIDTVIVNYNMYPNHFLTLWELVNTDDDQYKALRQGILKKVGWKKIRKMEENSNFIK